MTTFTSALKDLRQERNRLSTLVAGIDRALSLLNGATNHRTGRTVSAAGRARMASAQRARWAKIKGHKVTSIGARKGRTMSPAARKRIVAAQKARWAAWRKANGKSE